LNAEAAKDAKKHSIILAAFAAFAFQGGENRIVTLEDYSAQPVLLTSVKRKRASQQTRYSRWTSLAFLSSRNARNVACRRLPSRVHSTNAISATSCGFTHRSVRISSAVIPSPQ